MSVINDNTAFWIVLKNLPQLVDIYTRNLPDEKNLGIYLLYIARKFTASGLCASIENKMAAILSDIQYICISPEEIAGILCKDIVKKLVIYFPAPRPEVDLSAFVKLRELALIDKGIDIGGTLKTCRDLPITTLSIYNENPIYGFFDMISKQFKSLKSFYFISDEKSADNLFGRFKSGQTIVGMSGVVQNKYDRRFSSYDYYKFTEEQLANYDFVRLENLDEEEIPDKLELLIEESGTAISFNDRFAGLREIYIVGGDENITIGGDVFNKMPHLSKIVLQTLNISGYFILDHNIDTLSLFGCGVMGDFVLKFKQIKTLLICDMFWYGRGLIKLEGEKIDKLKFYCTEEEDLYEIETCTAEVRDLYVDHMSLLYINLGIVKCRNMVKTTPRDFCKDIKLPRLFDFDHLMKRVEQEYGRGVSVVSDLEPIYFYSRFLQHPAKEIDRFGEYCEE